VSLQAVWFKRDLRTFDHEALFRACQAGPTICFYVVEHEYWKLNNTSNRQWHFVRESLIDLAAQLEKIGGTLVIHQGSVVEFLQKLLDEHGAFTLHSHIETGIAWTYQRDIAVMQWCKTHRLHCQEYSQNGVCRPIRARNNTFMEHWVQWVSTPLFEPPNPTQFSEIQGNFPLEHLPIDICLDKYPCPGRQPGGRNAGLQVFESFLSGRGEAYSGSISSPITAESACSRLSTYISYGCLSLREIAQHTADRQEYAPSRQWAKSLAAFSRRLWWHCHWIQSFESRSGMEAKPIMAKMKQLERPFNQANFDAWSSGNTGWPLVDACMRFLHHQGWINFRMRAMLVSAATHSLSLPWQPVADFLAGLFVDFEPGIHYPQIQMQSGMMGNTVLRIYNPVSQAIDLDVNGNFVRKWVPELRQVSQTWIYEPWKMTPNLQEQAGWTKDYFYALPLVDYQRVHKEVKAAVSEIRAAGKSSVKQTPVHQGGTASIKKPKALKKKVSADPAQIPLF
jgi:deoxyribodipyrimidine photo-lyase